MTARFFIFLPFDLLITENEEWPTIELNSPEYRIRIYPPVLNAERPNAAGSVLGQVSATLNPPVFTENLLVQGRRVAQVNVLIMDFVKAEFDRSDQPTTPRDPKPELAFEVANEFLTRIRVYSRAFQIKPVVIDRDPWRVRYLTDDAQELEIEQGKIRGLAGGRSTIGFAALTLEVVELVRSRWQTAEPYSWDLLLLDAKALVPEVGSAIVIAAAALETFIGWALNILHESRPLPGRLWDWINDRDHWSKEPSVSEEFDVLLRVFTGHSLKEDAPNLWQQYSELRQARNTLIHEGLAKIGGKPVEPAKAKLLIDAAEKVVNWVEGFVPEEHRRARTAASGPFARRIATPQESDSLGAARTLDGELGPLPPGGKLNFAFEPKSDTEHRPGDRPDDATNSAGPELSFVNGVLSRATEVASTLFTGGAISARQK